MAAATQSRMSVPSAASAPSTSASSARIVPALGYLVGAKTVAMAISDEDIGASATHDGKGQLLDPEMIRSLSWSQDELTRSIAARQTQWFEASDGGAVLRLCFFHDACSLLLVLRFDEPLAPCQIRLKDQIAPLREAVSLGWAQEREAAMARDRNRASISMLNDSEYGIVALDERHQAFLINRAAENIVADNLVQLRRGHLRPAERDEAVRFELAVDAMIEASRIDADAEASVMLLSANGRRGALMAIIAPVRGGAPAVDSAGPAALVYLFRPDQSDLRGFDVLGELMGLSGAELRLVSQLSLGKTLAEAARALKVKPDTARGYLKQIFAKTNTHRQADLIAKMQRYQRGMRGGYSFRAA